MGLTKEQEKMLEEIWESRKIQLMDELEQHLIVVLNNMPIDAKVGYRTEIGDQLREKIRELRKSKQGGRK